MTTESPINGINVKNCTNCRNLFTWTPGENFCLECRVGADPQEKDVQEKLVSQINTGRTSTVLLQWLEPVLSEVEQDALMGMKRNFKEGKPSEALIAKLSVIDDIRTKIKSKISAGDNAADKLNGGNEDGN